MIKCASCNKEIAAPAYTVNGADGTKEHYCSRMCAEFSGMAEILLNIHDQIIGLREDIRALHYKIEAIEAQITPQNQPRGGGEDEHKT